MYLHDPQRLYGSGVCVPGALAAGRILVCRASTELLADGDEMNLYADRILIEKETNRLVRRAQNLYGRYLEIKRSSKRHLEK